MKSRKRFTQAQWCCFALKIDPGFAPNIDPPSGPIMA